MNDEDDQSTPPADEPNTPSTKAWPARWPLPADYSHVVSFEEVLGEKAETVEAGAAEKATPAEGLSEEDEGAAEGTGHKSPSS